MSDNDAVLSGDSSPTELTGRVVRLHFRCHAELPIGSFLRVTGSTLWAPGTNASDPSDSSTAIGRTAEHSAFWNSPQSLYTSSVEMVTTPEDYPLWWTRRPVVVVLHNSRKTVQHHYYRYLVVSPGGQTTPLPARDDEPDSAMQVSTSQEETGTTAVVEWEDPFGTLLAAAHNQVGEVSAVSLASTIIMDQINGADYRNLPYRTIDLDVLAAQQPLLASPDDVAARIDHWDNPDDATFRAYRIREAIREETRRKLQPRLSDVTDRSDGSFRDLMDTATSDAEGTTTPGFSGNPRIFFVCFHLPVVVVQDAATGQWNASWSESILAKTEGSHLLSAYECYWVGTVTTHPPLQAEQDQQAIKELLKAMNCIPIFLDPNVRHAHYYGFCKQVLWPAFHNIDLLDLNTSGWTTTDPGASDWDQSRLDDWWKSYIQVNQVFCDVMGNLLRRNDIVWIHDYHLCILPELLFQWEVQTWQVKSIRKVFFLHIPFPTSQIFREIECGEKILEGMLHADVVGFHAFDHARHFLNAAKRILGLNYESLVGGLIGVNFKGSTVLVSMSNVSISPRMVDAVLTLPSVHEGCQSLRRKHHGRYIISGVDIGQRLSGTALKLLAYERLLQDYPAWVSRVVMVQRLIVPGSRKADEDLTVREVRALVKRIQDKFGPAVIDYEEEYTGIPMDRRMALWKASDVLMMTPIREGLNHWPMEYIYAHRAPEAAGVVITSEFSAMSSILNGALRVNPYDIPMAIVTIDKALTMNTQDREGRRYRDIDFVSKSPNDKWVKNVLRDLRDATTRPTGRGSSESNSQISTPYATPTPHRLESAYQNSTAAFLARESSLAFCHLNARALRRAYEAAKKRVLILDFNGTIVPKEPPGKYLKREILGTSGNKPPALVLDALNRLSRDPRNVVYVVSGDSAENVLNALGHISGLGLAVSNGAKFSPPLKEGESERSWYSFDLGVDWDAVKRVALPVLSKYTARSNGSFVKLTSFSIGWSYYSCDPEWGSLQASHLVLELERELRAFDVRFVTLKGIVEVVPRKLNKGLIVKQILRDVDANNHDLDFVLCYGDDISDEKMFTSVFSFLAEQGNEKNSTPGPPLLRQDGSSIPSRATSNSSAEEVDRPVNCFTVAVGKKPSHANFWVEDAQEVADSLVLLATGKVPDGGVQLWEQSSTLRLFEN